MAIDSLAYIFDRGSDAIVKNLRASSLVNWVKDEYAMGAYAYKTP